MSVQKTLKSLSGEKSGKRDHGEHEAAALLSEMLDGGADELELGALLALLECRPVTPPELLGYARALAQRCSRLTPPAESARPVVFASYHGLRAHPHLLPLVALMLQRLGVPVLVHGALDGAGGVAAAYVFRELDVSPCASLVQAQSRLDERGLAFVPGAVLAPGLAELMARKGRLGFGGFAQSLARVLAPFGEEALHVISACAVLGTALLREHLAARGTRDLLLEGVEGEAFANPQRRPCIEYFALGESRVLFGAEPATLTIPTALPATTDAHTVASWIRRALSGDVPIPLPIVNQIACCLYGAGYTDDMNQAKAIVAVETGNLNAA